MDSGNKTFLAYKLVFLSDINNCVCAQGAYFHLELDGAKGGGQAGFLILLDYFFIVGEQDNTGCFVEELVGGSKNQDRLFDLRVDGEDIFCELGGSV